MRKLKTIILTALLQAVALTSWAQITSVHGTVSDDEEPLIGATVCEIDANGRIIESAITDLDGNFTMKIQNPKNKIRFTYVGMKTQILPIDRTTYNVKLESAASLQEVTVVSKRRLKCNGLRGGAPQHPWFDEGIKFQRSHTRWAELLHLQREWRLEDLRKSGRPVSIP